MVAITHNGPIVEVELREEDLGDGCSERTAKYVTARKEVHKRKK